MALLAAFAALGGLLAIGWAFLFNVQTAEAASNQERIQQINIRNSRTGCQYVNGVAVSCITVHPPANLPAPGSVGAACLYYYASGGTLMNGQRIFTCSYPGYGWPTYSGPGPNGQGGYIPPGQCRDIWTGGYATHTAWCVYPPPQLDPPTCTIASATFDVADADTRISITLDNPNDEAMTIDLAEYTIEKTGSPDNQTNVDALAVAGNPSTIPGNGQVVLYSTARAMTHEGDYSVSWDIQTTTQKEGQSIGRDINCASDLHILPIPPTCVIEAAAFGILDPAAKAKIILENPNGGAMTISAAEYTIERSGSPDNQLNVDALAISGNPATIPGGGQAVLYSDPRAMSQDGRYSVSWTITAGLGTDSWSTAASEIQTDAGGACGSSLKVVYRPFVKIFYGGLVAGGQFGSQAASDACGQNFQDALGGDLTVQAFIAGHMEGSGPSDARGSSVEYALQAWGVIGGFYSASQRSSDPIPIKGLTLANSGSASSGRGWERKMCLANWWRGAERLDLETKPSPLELELGDLNPNDRLRYELSSSETLELAAAAPLGGLKATLYIKGDVLITSDIDNQVATRWHDPSEIGVLSIIVKGNIDIAPAVGRIDALLVAYPSGLDAAGEPLDGRIRTCWQAGLTAANHLQTCSRQLVVNGALAAEKILFGRVHASIRQETAFPATPSTTRASEIINLLPEHLIGIPELPFFADQPYKTESTAPKASNF